VPRAASMPAAWPWRRLRFFRREQRPWMVEIDDQLVSEGYLELTLRTLRRAGFRVDRSRSSLEILAWDARVTTPPTVPADWSAGGFLLPIAWRISGSVAGLDLDDIHPDRAIVEHLHHVGLELDTEPPLPSPPPCRAMGRGWPTRASTERSTAAFEPRAPGPPISFQRSRRWPACFLTRRSSPRSRGCAARRATDSRRSRTCSRPVEQAHTWTATACTSSPPALSAGGGPNQLRFDARGTTG